MCEFNSFKSIFHKNNDLNMLRHDYLHDYIFADKKLLLMFLLVQIYSFGL